MKPRRVTLFLRLRVSFVLLLLVRIFVPPAASAETQTYAPLDWLDSPDAGPYQGIRGELDSLFSQAQAAGLPSEVLMDTLREGTAKRVSPPLLLGALRSEWQRDRGLLSLFQSIPLTRQAPLGDLIRRGSVLLRGGISMDTLDALLDYTRILGKTTDRALSAAGAALRIVAISEGDPSAVGSLAQCLVRSTLGEEDFTTLVSVALKGKRLGITREPFIRLLQGTLDKGGGITSVDRELERRGKN